MSAPGGGFDADPAAIHDAGGPMAAAEDILKAFGAAIEQGAENAGGGAGEGPLESALASFGSDGNTRATELGRECREVSQDLHDAADEYTDRDGQAASQLDAVPFGN